MSSKNDMHDIHVLLVQQLVKQIPIVVLLGTIQREYKHKDVTSMWGAQSQALRRDV